MEHTQGKLTFRGFSIYAADGKTPVADTCLTASVAQHDEANARRLVACWNACEGVSTEWLEAQTDPDSEELFGKVAPLDKRLQSAMQEIAALKAQRDELLAGLQLAYIAMQHMGNVLNNIDAVDEEEDAQHDAAFEAVAALIAKHKEAIHG